MEIVVGVIAMFVADVINRKIDNSRLRFLLIVVLSLVGGLLTVLTQIKVATPQEIIASASMVFTTSQVLYKLLYKDSSLQGKIRGTTSSNQAAGDVSVGL